MKRKRIPENFLHFLWQAQCFNQHDLKTTAGEVVRIEKTGYSHMDAGPDFLNARIWIGDTRWAGHVEIHVNSSEWIDHKHQNDPAYDNVILHVVLEEDKIIERRMGGRIPCLELHERLPKNALRLYFGWMKNKTSIPCKNQILQVPEMTKKFWLDRLLIERLQGKVSRLEQYYNHYKGDWEQIFRVFLFRGFGLRVNADAMEMLAMSLPVRLIDHYRYNLLDVEAILYGQASLIPTEISGSFLNELRKRHQFLSHKHQLMPIRKSVWKYSRLRPNAFPDLRIAHLASLICHHPNWVSEVLDFKSRNDLSRFLNVKVSPYWQRHYRFGSPTDQAFAKPGKEWLNILLLNVIIPFLFFYGRKTNRQKFEHKALSWIEKLPVENNRITRMWKGMLDLKTAGAGQASIELFKNYCQEKKCLDCQIGQALIGRSTD